jgi:hypothetical protein
MKNLNGAEASAGSGMQAGALACIAHEAWRHTKNFIIL